MCKAMVGLEDRSRQGKGHKIHRTRQITSRERDRDQAHLSVRFIFAYLANRSRF